MSDSQATLAERRASRRIGGGARGEADGADASDASPLRLSVRIPSLLDDGEAKSEVGVPSTRCHAPGCTNQRVGLLGSPKGSRIGASHLYCSEHSGNAAPAAPVAPMSPFAQASLALLTRERSAPPVLLSPPRHAPTSPAAASIAKVLRSFSQG